MNQNEILVCSLDEARGRAGLDGTAPALAARLRTQGAAAACIWHAREQLHWLDTPHAQGWLGAGGKDRPGFTAALRDALAQGFVAADAAVVAAMDQPHALPLLSWGDALPSAPPASVANRPLDLYAIVDSAARLQQVLAAGVRTVQLRIKQPAQPDAAWRRMLRTEVARAVACSEEAGAELFVNDHWRLAHELGAGGVHLGQEDLVALGDAGRAELRATGMALGISSHSLWELSRARTLSPRYIACGPVWPTLTKDMLWLPQGLDNLAWWCRAAQAPVTAIGGILGPQQVRAAASTGADGVCVVRGLGEDPRLSVPSFQAALAAGRAEGRAAPAWPHPTLPH
jgi:hydroxymethylpyrimidine kinase/phosphomethylpyrimidine kinase/thiamine-phosphate diphosphorylase